MFKGGKPARDRINPKARAMRGAAPRSPPSDKPEREVPEPDSLGG
jgi:hypothetical protein